MSAPLTCLSVLVSHDPVGNPQCLQLLSTDLLFLQGLDLRVEHTHCFSDHGEGGHYHYDTTPDEASYVGYYVPGEYIFRIGRPKVSHNVGRD